MMMSQGGASTTLYLYSISISEELNLSSSLTRRREQKNDKARPAGLLHTTRGRRIIHVSYKTPKTGAKVSHLQTRPPAAPVAVCHNDQSVSSNTKGVRRLFPSYIHF